MAIPADTVLRIVASMLHTDGNVSQNVFNAIITGGGAPYADADIVDDAEAWLDNMYANLTNYCTDEIDGNEVIVYKYDPVGADWDEVSSQSWTWNPTQSATELPRAVAGLVRMWTTDPDVQGKKYIPALTQGHNVDGLWVASMLVVLLAFGADWYTPFTGATSGATWTPGIWSVVQTAFLAGVDHIASTTIPAYQRRRKRNIGI